MRTFTRSSLASLALPTFFTAAVIAAWLFLVSGASRGEEVATPLSPSELKARFGAQTTGTFNCVIYGLCTYSSRDCYEYGGTYCTFVGRKCDQTDTNSTGLLCFGTEQCANVSGSKGCQPGNFQDTACRETWECRCAKDQNNLWICQQVGGITMKCATLDVGDDCLWLAPGQCDEYVN